MIFVLSNMILKLVIPLEIIGKLAAVKLCHYIPNFHMSLVNTAVKGSDDYGKLCAIKVGACSQVSILDEIIIHYFKLIFDSKL